MTGKNRELEETRTAIAHAKADVRELTALAITASKHLGDVEGQGAARGLGQSALTKLTSLSHWLEIQQDVYDLTDNRGLNKALRSTLIERRNAISKLLEAMDGTDKER